MHRCPSCNFLSNTETGDIYDSRFPCPKCGKQAPKRKPVSVKGVKASRWVRHANRFNNPGLRGLGETAKPSKLLALARATSVGVSFYLAYNALNNIDAAEDEKDEKLKLMLGPVLPSLKTASYLIPALALPDLISIFTGKERPLVELAYKVAVVYGMVFVASRPFAKALDQEPEFVG